MKLQKAIFLDRDGVINNPGKHYYVWKTEDFVLNPTVIDRIKEYSEAGYLLFIITNQGGIAKGIYTANDLDKLHRHLLSILEKENVRIADIYYCPHHSETGKCLCRKPDSLLIEKALARYNVSSVLSYFIGDSDRDIQAAEKAGVKGILIPPNTELPSLSELK
jgi:D-glycero-D-manno-heptose 1,7-bisphosphate phosphatase